MAFGGWIQFDRKKFLKQKRREVMRALHFIGGDIRWKMQGKLKPRKSRNERSLPGQPPLIASKSSPLKKRILYAIDTRTEKITVGPTYWPESKSPVKVPAVLEKGGKAWYNTWEIKDPVRIRTRERYFRSRTDWEAARNSPRFLAWAREKRKKVQKVVNIKPRPFSNPALQDYLDGGGWQKSVKKAAEWGRTHNK